MSVRALIVEDSGPIRAVVRRALASVGITDVIEAADGVEGLKLFKSSVVDLVVTDFNMPNKDGLALVQDLRNLGTQVPIIMLTTEAERSSVIAAIQAGVTDYLIKPFDSELLKKKLKKIWGRAGAVS